MIHANVITLSVAGDGASHKPPAGLRRVAGTPLLRHLAGYLVAIGPLPEHVPKYARR
jgi:hypothetical protein